MQPWGSDGDKRRYYLIEGLDDTHFRVYREGSHTAVYKRTWFSVASDIEELKQLANKLETEDRGQKARVLSGKMLAAVPRFEATEEVSGSSHLNLFLKSNIRLETKKTGVQTSTKTTIQTPRTQSVSI